VSALALGAMMFGAWGNADETECHRMVHRALDAGVNLIDTADMYDNGRSEEIVGGALRGHRHRVVLATKVGNPMGGDPARSGLSRRWIVQACHDSLRRLQVDHIDVYQMHRPDPVTPTDETLEALDHLVRTGTVRAIGTSTFSAEQLIQLHTAAGDRAWVRPTSEQPPYSVLARGVEAEVLPLCRRLHVGAIVWAPLNGGWLTGKYQQRVVDPQSRARREADHFDHRDHDMRATKTGIVTQLTAIADEAGMTLAQMALAFVLDDPAVSAAIVGPRTDAQLAELLQIGPLDLPAGVRTRIDAVVAPGSNVNPADAG
jgi:aryl-alcohol dehydrogenase-like predicted oxidoreductase